VRTRLNGNRCARATAIAVGWTESAGWVPADVAGTRLDAVHAAAASWDRAELCVQTNTTRAAGRENSGVKPAKALGTNRTYERRRSPSERTRSINPASPSTRR
jgi:hypothetical protein